MITPSVVYIGFVLLAAVFGLFFVWTKKSVKKIRADQKADTIVSQERFLRTNRELVLTKIKYAPETVLTLEKVNELFSEYLPVNQDYVKDLDQKDREKLVATEAQILTFIEEAASKMTADIQGIKHFQELHQYFLKNYTTINQGVDSAVKKLHEILIEKNAAHIYSRFKADVEKLTNEPQVTAISSILHAIEHPWCANLRFYQNFLSQLGKLYDVFQSMPEAQAFITEWNKKNSLARNVIPIEKKSQPGSDRGQTRSQQR